jgi:hypothetical protein
MEEDSKSKINYKLIDIIRSIILGDDSIDIETIPVSYGENASFAFSKLKSDNFSFETKGMTITLKDNNETLIVQDDSEISDWIIALTNYLKQKDLLKDFKQFYLI